MGRGEYPTFIKTSLVVAGLLLLSPSSFNEPLSLNMKTDVITVDRTSPAFSAVEDALILKDINIESLKVKPNHPDVKLKRIDLDGAKVSGLNLKVKKFKLSGERIEVAHFTNKFLKPSTASLESLRLSAFKPDWAGGEQQVSAAGLKTVELPSGIKVSQVETGQIETSFQNDLKLSSAKLEEPIGLDLYSPKSLKGKISLEGAAFDESEDFSFYIARHYNGSIYETGVLDASLTSFEFEVGAAKGFLAIELRNQKGEVLAYAESDINLDKELSLNLVPTEGLFTGKVLDEQESKGGAEVGLAYALQSAKGVEGDLETDKEGFFGEDIFHKGSSLITMSKAKDYFPSVKLMETGKPLYPRLLSKLAVEKILSNLDPFGESLEVESLVLGKVTQLGLAQSGLSVRVYNQPYQKPVYINSFGQPDPKQSETTKEGGFIFSNLEAGGHLIQVLKKDQVLAQRWFIVKKGHMSSGQIELKKTKTALLKLDIFPPRSDVAVKSLSINELGTDDFNNLEFEKAEEVSLKTKPKVVAFQIFKTGESKRRLYLKPVLAGAHTFNFFDESWLQSFLNARRINQNTSLGIVVGKLDSDFRVLKDNSDLITSGSQILYFDKYGGFVDSGLAGGGFIVTNSAVGFKTLSVSIGQKLLNKVVLTAPDSVSSL